MAHRENEHQVAYLGGTIKDRVFREKQIVVLPGAHVDTCIFIKCLLLSNSGTIESSAFMETEVVDQMKELMRLLYIAIQ